MIIIEHNLDVIKFTDFLIDLGLDGGINDENIIAKGTLEIVLNSKESITVSHLE